MTCESARSLLKGAWTPSAGLAFVRHWQDCPDCQEWTQALCAHVPTKQRREYAAAFERNLLPQMLKAMATDPEI